MTYTLIQALRAVLCLGVVLMHIKIYLTRWGDPGIFDIFPYILGGIPCGFFAVSGYFMAMLVDRETPLFLPQRLIRIYPTYFIVVVLAVLMRSITTLPLNLDDLPQVLSLLPFGMGKSYKLGIEWTLVYEIWYYFICAFFCRPGWSKRFPAFLLFWLFAGILKDVLSFSPPLPVPNMLTVWLSIWGYSFIMGALTFYFLQRIHEPLTMAWALQVTFASAIAVSVLYMRSYAVLYLLGYLSCLILIGLIRLESRIRSPKVLALMGDYSYTLYLIHSNIIITVLDRFTAITGQPPGTMAGLMALVLCLGSFWYLGQLDVAIHKRLKGVVARTLSEGFPTAVRRLGSRLQR